MKINMYSVAFKKALPVKTGSKRMKDLLNFGFPFYARDAEEAKNVAVKSFIDKVSNTEDALNVDPCDFGLFLVAVFDATSEHPIKGSLKFYGTVADLKDRGYGVIPQEVINDETK